MLNMQSLVQEINDHFESAPTIELLQFCIEKFKSKLFFTSSLGAEDQVLTHMLVEIDPNIRIVTLDTGRLFPETLDLIQYTNEKYKISIEVLFPDYKQVELMVKEKGINLFYDSIENRLRCCDARKNEPLKRILPGMQAWITGIRREQSVNRKDTRIAEWDEKNNLIKINPLVTWKEKEVWDFIKLNKIPYNILHDKGYPSIGCAPCTRAVEKGQDIREGRWWWENDDTRECGLHQKGGS
jgi:phosphoadenosine phosphosulfate reductase